MEHATPTFYVFVIFVWSWVFIATFILVPFRGI